MRKCPLIVWLALAMYVAIGVVLPVVHVHHPHVASGGCEETGLVENEPARRSGCCAHSHPATASDSPATENDVLAGVLAHSHDHCLICDVLNISSQSPAIVAIAMEAECAEELCVMLRGVAFSADLLTPPLRGPPCLV